MVHLRLRNRPPGFNTRQSLNVLPTENMNLRDYLSKACEENVTSFWQICEENGTSFWQIVGPGTPLIPFTNTEYDFIDAVCFHPPYF